MRSTGSRFRLELHGSCLRYGSSSPGSGRALIRPESGYQLSTGVHHTVHASIRFALLSSRYGCCYTARACIRGPSPSPR